MQEMPQVAVLGQTGALGAHVARRLDARGYRVRARWSDARTLDEAERVRWGWAPRSSMRDALLGCDAAVYITPTLGAQEDAARILDARAFLEAALARRGELLKVTFVSSVEALGLPDPDGETPRDEDAHLVAGSGEPSRARAIHYMEGEVYRYLVQGVPAVIAAPGWMEGPGDVRPERIAAQLDSAGRWSGAARLPGTLWLADVREVARGVVTALERGRPGRRFVLGGAPASRADVLAALGHASPETRAAAAMHRASALAQRALRQEQAPLAMTADVDSARATQELDYTPGDPLDALRASALWWAEAGEG